MVECRFAGWIIPQLTDILRGEIALPSGRSDAVPPLHNTLTPEFDLSYHSDGPQDAVGVHFGIHQTTGRLTQTSGKLPILCDFFSNSFNHLSRGEPDAMESVES